MPLPTSTLYLACNVVLDFLKAQLDANTNSIDVKIGSPKDSAPATGASKHVVNLFFHRFEPDGFDTGVASDEVFRVRAFCLVTAFGIADDKFEAGENDLHLLGEVMRAFHEHPVLEKTDIDGEEVRLRAVPVPFGPEELNHVWGTQGDVAYRPSAAYEFALIPIHPREPATGSQLVGSVGWRVDGSVPGSGAPFAGPFLRPRVVKGDVDLAVEGWAPRVCFVEDAVCVESLAFEVGTTALTGFTPAVWIAGESGATVALKWEIWDDAAGWREGTSMSAVVGSAGIDPDAADTAATTSFALPFKDKVGQAVLYAQRTYTRKSDGAEVSVRSNPLLVSLFGGSP